MPSDPLTTARVLLERAPKDIKDLDLECVTLPICTQCIDGAGGECHTPGCALYLNRAPDISIRRRAEEADMRIVPRLAAALRALADEHKRVVRERDDARREAAELRAHAEAPHE